MSAERPLRSVIAPVLTGHAVPELRDGDLVLRAQHADDLDALTAMIHDDPQARQWWGLDKDRAGYRRDLASAENGGDANDDSLIWTIVLDGSVAGWLCAWERVEPEHGHAGLDISLARSARGRGAATRALRLVIDWIFATTGHHRITIDPDARNAPAIACYERVGFRRVGVLRQDQITPDGRWTDTLLLDLLRDDVRA